MLVNLNQLSHFNVFVCGFNLQFARCSSDIRLLQWVKLHAGWTLASARRVAAPYEGRTSSDCETCTLHTASMGSVGPGGDPEGSNDKGEQGRRKTRITAGWV